MIRDVARSLLRRATLQHAMSEARRNPAVFVVGCPRSGTTLLQRMLDNHPKLAVANDTHFIPRAIDWDTSTSEHVTSPLLTAALVARVRDYHRFVRMGLDSGTVADAASASDTYARFVERLYDALAAANGKPLAGEKTPDYVRCLRLLDGLFPWARILHIVRDGRDVALSTLEWANEGKGPGRFALWRDEPVAVCALWWAWQVSSGRQDGERLGSTRYREVRYEELVDEPETRLHEISEWLALPFAEEMLRFHEGRTRNASGLSAKSAWLPPTAGLRDWRRAMRAEDVELFEALSGDTLAEFGYERSFTSIAPPIAARAARCAEWWRAEMDRRAAKRRATVAPT